MSKSYYTVYQIAGKRVLDLCLALVIFIPAIFLFLICAAAISYERDGPILFKQTRVGKNQKTFTLFKLRTMPANTEHRPSHEITDAKISRTRGWLRQLKLDELPQIINVIMGDMSFVGPRPCLPSQQELIKLRTERDVYSVRPGITGLAQVNGIDMSQPEELSLVDSEYVNSVSFCRDLRLIALTFVGRGGGDAIRRG